MANTTLKIDNTYSQLFTDDDKVLNILWGAMRFRERNYYHNVRYKMKLWDGFVDFFKRETGKFLTGLLPEVRLALKQMKVDYTVQDNRNSVKFTVDSVDAQWLNKFLQPGIKPVELRDYQIDYINQSIRNGRGIIYAPTSAGKAQPLDSLVYTPSGPRRMGDIEVDSIVCTPDGGEARVAAVFPQGVKEVCRITFSNGDSVECCEDHLWKVDAIMDGWQGKIKDTKYLENNLASPSGRPRYKIQKSDPVQFNHSLVELEPYLMGVLLGDGRLGNDVVWLSNADEQLLKHVRGMLREGYELKHNGKYDYRITQSPRSPKRSFYLEVMRHYNLAGKRSHEKFIPKCYKYNTVENRMNIVRGLMDTDGYVDGEGHLEFGSSSKQLALDFKEIVESLGVVCHWREKEPTYTYKEEKKRGRRHYTVTLAVEGDSSEFFSLSRKKKRCGIRGKKGTDWIISKIERIGKKECRCILVDSEHHLYLTDHCVPTHNTNVLVGILLTLPPDTPTLVLANRKSLVDQNYDEIKQWGIKNVGRFYGDHKEIRNITCATVQSAHLLKKYFPQVKCLFVDEIHEMMSKKPRAVYNACKNASVRIGMSATPFKFGEKDKVQKYEVKGYIGPVFLASNTETGRLSTKDLQKREILASADCTFFPVHEPKIPHHIYLDAVTDGIAHNMVLHEMTCRLVKSLEGRTLIIVERIPHGDLLHDMIPGSVWVRGQDTIETRKVVIKRLKEEQGNVIAIATAGIFNTGINVFVHSLVNCAGGQAEHQIIQRFGRGLRVADDKKHLKYYDWYFTINDYLEKHSTRRMAILEKEGHNVTLKERFDI
jgi:superfamily II DNA or RNA helicase